MGGMTRRKFMEVGAVGAGMLAVGVTHLEAQEAQQKPLRVGFIGVGGRGGGLLQTALGLPGVEIVAICDTNPARLSNAISLVEKRTGKPPQGYGEDRDPFAYRKLLERDDIDCLVIATPCNWHGRMYVDCLNAKKHFYGEKPIAITVREIEMIQEARKRNPDVVVQIGFQWAASMSRADIVRKIRDGMIGELIEGRFHRYNGWGSLGRWFNRRELSGDWMLEQAVHEFNLLWWVTQAHPIAAYARGRRNVVEPENKERNITDYYTAVLEYPNGFIVHYTHGWISPPGYTGMSCRIIGTKGGADILDCTMQLRGQQQPIRGEGPGGDTREHMQNFFDAVKARDPKTVYAGIENGIAASYVGLMIRKSLDEGRRVTFEEMLQDREELPPLVLVD